MYNYVSANQTHMFVEARKRKRLRSVYNVPICIICIYFVIYACIYIYACNCMYIYAFIISYTILTDHPPIPIISHKFIQQSLAVRVFRHLGFVLLKECKDLLVIPEPLERSTYTTKIAMGETFNRWTWRVSSLWAYWKTLGIHWMALG